MKKAINQPERDTFQAAEEALLLGHQSGKKGKLSKVRARERADELPEDRDVKRAFVPPKAQALEKAVVLSEVGSAEPREEDESSGGEAQTVLDGPVKDAASGKAIGQSDDRNEQTRSGPAKPGGKLYSLAKPPEDF